MQNHHDDLTHLPYHLWDLLLLAHRQYDPLSAELRYKDALEATLHFMALTLAACARSLTQTPEALHERLAPKVFGGGGFTIATYATLIGSSAKALGSQGNEAAPGSGSLGWAGAVNQKREWPAIAAWCRDEQAARIAPDAERFSTGRHRLSAVIEGWIASWRNRRWGHGVTPTDAGRFNALIHAAILELWNAINPDGRHFTLARLDSQAGRPPVLMRWESLTTHHEVLRMGYPRGSSDDFAVPIVLAGDHLVPLHGLAVFPDDELPGLRVLDGIEGSARIEGRQGPRTLPPYTLRFKHSRTGVIDTRVADHDPLAVGNKPLVLTSADQAGQSSDHPASRSDEPASIRGPYQLIEHIGSGGMGTVYRARHQDLDREVAFKVIHVEHAADPSLQGRFRREAALLARIHHPNIVGIHDAGEDQLGHYLVMEYLHGLSLGKVLRKASDRLEQEGTVSATSWADLCGASGNLALPAIETEPEDPDSWPKLIATMFADLVDGLAAVHNPDDPEQGVFHRDIKPDNIMVVGGRHLVLIDFGLAKSKIDDALTMTGQGPYGTPAYMAPEQVPGNGQVSVATDIFAIGLVMAECLTLKPVRDLSPGCDLERTISEPVVVDWKTPMGRRVPKPLRQVVEKCLRPVPGDRYARSAWLAGDLRSIAQGERPEYLADSTGRAFRRRGRNFIYAVVGFSVPVVLLVMFLTFFILPWEDVNERKDSINDRLSAVSGRQESGTLTAQDQAMLEGLWAASSSGLMELWARGDLRSILVMRICAAIDLGDLALARDLLGSAEIEVPDPALSMLRADIRLHEALAAGDIPDELQSSVNELLAEHDDEGVKALRKRLANTLTESKP